MRSVKRNYVSDRGIAYCAEGSGPCVLLIHAFGFDATMWTPQISFLVDRGYRVLAHDHRGFGLSPKPATNHSFESSVADAVSVLDHAGVGSAVVAGVSMGSATAVAMAISRPARVAGLLLADNSRPDGPERGAAAADRIRDLGMVRLADLYEPILFGESFRRRHPGYVSAWRERLIALDADDLAAVVAPYHGRPDPGPHLERVDVPTAIVFGSEDAAVADDRRQDYMTIPSAKQFLIDGAGHMSSLERPAEFNRILLNVIEHAFPSGSVRRNGVTIEERDIDTQAPS